MARPPRLVLAHGCFDLLHLGHVAFLEAARTYGDRLIVSVTPDRFVRAQKGDGHPHFPQDYRAAMLRALRVVDTALIAPGPDATAVIRLVQPAVYVKGIEYTVRDGAGYLPRETAAVEAVGGVVQFIDATPRYSSTALLRALA